MSTKEEEYVYRSKLPDISIPKHMPLHAYCFERMAELKGRACIIEGSNGKVYQYEQVQSISTRVGGGLARLGVGRGDVIMIVLPNCPEFVFTFLGASFIGAITTPANPHYTPGEIAKQAHASGAQLVITKAAYVEKLKNVKQHLIIVTLEDPAPQGCVAFSKVFVLLYLCNVTLKSFSTKILMNIQVHFKLLSGLMILSSFGSGI
ncbi:hypothetical protein SUGI_0530480 [Cryptomeria japonica]|nr:hypothetical protein SUGI_0530480 [Cryptomeria japonica]